MLKSRFCLKLTFFWSIFFYFQRKSNRNSKEINKIQRKYGLCRQFLIVFVEIFIEFGVCYDIVIDLVRRHKDFLEFFCRNLAFSLDFYGDNIVILLVFLGKPLQIITNSANFSQKTHVFLVLRAFIRFEISRNSSFFLFLLSFRRNSLKNSKKPSLHSEISAELGDSPPLFA